MTQEDVWSQEGRALFLRPEMADDGGLSDAVGEDPLEEAQMVRFSSVNHQPKGQGEEG